MRKISLFLAIIAITLFSSQNIYALKIGIIGNNSASSIATLLNNNSHSALQISLSQLDSTFDAAILLRTNGDQGLINFVQNGGLLITEWVGADWALNTAGLLNASVSGDGPRGATNTVSFTQAGLDAGLGVNIGSGYSDPGRTDHFRNIVNISGDTQLLATIPGGTPNVIVGGPSGDGAAVIIGYDWADGFNSSLTNNGQLILNALNFQATNATPVPEPATATLLLTVLALCALKYSTAWKRVG